VLDESYVRSLAGVIEYEQADHAIARVDLEAAQARAPTDCVARAYLAAVGRAEQRWALAGRDDERAMTCFTDRAPRTSRRGPRGPRAITSTPRIARSRG
jgi:hypothetical protein